MSYQSAQEEAICYILPKTDKRSGHFCLTLTLYHRVSSDCLTICGEPPVMPRATFRSTDPVHTVSTLRQASPQLGIPLDWRGSPNSTVFPRQITLPGHLQLMEYLKVASITGHAHYCYHY